ncbi:TIGR03503 family protein [Alteromonas aestuariivivens]|uniref:TIGR03503 family protein n=1 Tax=Alteromonas aestuariivivens TaxID=1938339 RepID=A0A3D8MBU6_9ALTE|nr:TIGR03503 family protein [Alteromonas aestuariivivens]RDV27601.1 TIGR03503 family protein [Alteromonas aestuariivivens]
MFRPKLWLAGLAALCCFYASAQQQASDAVNPTAESPIEQLGSEFHNSIQLLQNRFRVDHNVEELTLVFFREYGSAPVVLVQPDGSKIFQGQVEDMDEDGPMYWFYTETYDLIRIKNPVPGPWQAVGQVLPGSRAMVLSDLKLHVAPLPSMIFSGEILKQTAHLTNGGKPLEFNQFRDLVELTFELISTNNPDFDNFGADNELVARFEDNGRGMDEAPLDGVFTGQFNLSVPAGEWTPVFRVSTPMFTREQVEPELRLHPNPVNVSVVQDSGEEGYHALLIDANRELVKMDTLLVDGKIRYPNGDMQNFSLTKLSSDIREHRIIAYEEGIFRVKLTAYGSTVNGREFILDVPEFTFLAEFPVPEEEFIEEVSELELQAPFDEETLSDEIPSDYELVATISPESEPEMDSATLTMWLLAVNGSILMAGGMIVGLLIWRRRKLAA